MMKYVLMLAMLIVSMQSYGKANENRGWYAGAGDGAAKISMPNQSATLDDSDGSITLFGGFRFNRFLAVQGHYVNLGKFTDDQDPVLNYTELNGFGATAVGLLPISNSGFDLFGRLGITILHYTQNFELLGENFDNSSTGDAVTASFGVNYTHPSLKPITFHIAYDYYYFETQKTYSTSNEYDSNSIGVLGFGARYNF